MIPKHLTIVTSLVVAGAATTAFADADTADVASVATNVAAATSDSPDACPADVTLDGRVDFADLLAVLSNYGSATGTLISGQSLKGDVDGNGFIDFADLLEIIAHYNESCGA